MQQTKPTIHMIGQAHLDPVWLWRWTEGVPKRWRPSKSAVDRLQEYSEFPFHHGERHKSTHGSRKRTRPYSTCAS